MELGIGLIGVYTRFYFPSHIGPTLTRKLEQDYSRNEVFSKAIDFTQYEVRERKFSMIFLLLLDLTTSNLTMFTIPLSKSLLFNVMVPAAAVGIFLPSCSHVAIIICVLSYQSYAAAAAAPSKQGFFTLRYRSERRKESWKRITIIWKKPIPRINIYADCLLTLGWLYEIGREGKLL